MPSIDLPDHVSATSDEIVTQVIAVKNVSAAQLRDGACGRWCPPPAS